MTRALKIAIAAAGRFHVLDLARELHELGISSSPEEIVLRWAELAQGCGLDGVVASPQEVEAIRRVCGRGFIIVTPGIRLQSAATDDQARTATPEFALKAGANFLVVGRPITTAPDPAAATDAIVGEVARALGDALEETGAAEACVARTGISGIQSRGIAFLINEDQYVVND